MKLRKLPKMVIDTEQVMRVVDANRDLVGFPSIIRGVGYATDGNDVLVVTSRGGYLRMHADSLRIFIEELKWIDEEVERRSRD